MDEESLFPRTQWTQLAGAAHQDREALDRLIRLYWEPLRVYLVSRFPTLRDQADEFLQQFSTDKILREGWLARADRSRGRFRDFLKRSLRNFILDHFDKRDVRHPPSPLDDVEEELAGPEAPSEKFDLAWARVVLAEALRRMEADCREPGDDQPRRSQRWELFRVRLLDPILEEAEPVAYEELVARFGLHSPSEAFNLLLSAKRLFKSHLRRVVAGYEGADRATADEIDAIDEFLRKIDRSQT